MVGNPGPSGKSSIRGSGFIVLFYFFVFGSLASNRANASSTLYWHFVCSRYEERQTVREKERDERIPERGTGKIDRYDTQLSMNSCTLVKVALDWASSCSQYSPIRVSWFYSIKTHFHRKINLLDYKIVEKKCLLNILQCKLRSNFGTRSVQQKKNTSLT